MVRLLAISTAVLIAAEQDVQLVAARGGTPLGILPAVDSSVGQEHAPRRT